MVYHRDIKADNILIDPETNLVKLTDFGLSILAEDQMFDNKLNTFCGTINYLAPEILEKQGYYGPKADIWSLGVLLYTMASGRSVNRISL